MSNRTFITREIVNLKDLRKQDEYVKKKKKKEKKQGSKPFINKQNKILLPTRNNIAQAIRESNRTKYLIEMEFMP